MVGIVAVVIDEVLHVAECLQSERFEQWQVWHQGYRIYLSLIDSGNAPVQTLKRLQVEIVAEGVCCQGHVVEFSMLHQRLHLTTVVRKHDAQTTELIVDELEHARQSAELSAIFVGNLHIAFIAQVVLDGGPHMLQTCAHL